MNISTVAMAQQTPVQINRTGGSVNSSLKAVAANMQKATVKNDERILKAEVDPKKVSKAVEEIQRLCNMCNRKLQFRVNKDTNRITIKVIDSNTDKVIREIPSEEIQKLQARIRETVGLLFDEAI